MGNYRRNIDGIGCLADKKYSLRYAGGGVGDLFFPELLGVKGAKTEKNKVFILPQKDTDKPEHYLFNVVINIQGAEVKITFNESQK